MASAAADRLASELFFSRRELRLRARIDGLLAQRAAKERRILALEELLRMDGADERIVVLEGSTAGRKRWMA